MFDDEEDEDGGFFLLVLGVLAAILVVVTVVARSGDDLPAATVTGPTTSEVEETPTTEAPTTTAAPETTTTEAPETTTTTEVAAPFTMWDALGQSGQATDFAAVAGVLGLQADLESLENDDGSPVMRTLFAPSDQALSLIHISSPRDRTRSRMPSSA